MVMNKMTIDFNMFDCLVKDIVVCELYCSIIFIVDKRGKKTKKPLLRNLHEKLSGKVPYSYKKYSVKI